MKMREHEIRCPHPGGTHRMAYVEWGDADNPAVLFCVHGLTRCSRDFDALAEAMSDQYRVICPDVAGRGRSEWLPDPAMYNVPQYAADMMVLIRHLAPATLHWLGTSMGGLIGMGLASQAVSSSSAGLPAISKLVLNDVGPVITAISLQRIGQYLGKPVSFPDMAAACAFVQATSPGFGNLSPAQWQHLTEHVVHPDASGQLVFRYDPRIVESFAAALRDSGGQDIELWPLYEQIACPTLLLRGADSDLLTRDTALAMTRRGPQALLVEFAGIGHAPVLMDPAQIKVVRNFLLS